MSAASTTSLLTMHRFCTRAARFTPESPTAAMTATSTAGPNRAANPSGGPACAGNAARSRSTPNFATAAVAPVITTMRTVHAKRKAGKRPKASRR